MVQTVSVSWLLRELLPGGIVVLGLALGGYGFSSFASDIGFRTGRLLGVVAGLVFIGAFLWLAFGGARPKTWVDDREVSSLEAFFTRRGAVLAPNLDPTDQSKVREILENLAQKSAIQKVLVGAEQVPGKVADRVLVSYVGAEPEELEQLAALGGEAKVESCGEVVRSGKRVKVTRVSVIWD